MAKDMTKEELLAKLEALGSMDDDQRNHVVCSLIGHSRIQTTFWGYFYCGRCGDQVGDNLAGVYADAQNVTVVGHDCPTCHANYERMSWRDKIFAPEPFTKLTVDNEKA